MAVKSRETTDSERGALRPPLSRAELDRAAPWLRLVLGAALIAWSAYTTVLGIGVDLAPLVDGRSVYGVPLAVIVGLGVAGLITLIQWLTSEHVPLVYAAALIVDARYTQWQIGPWIEPLAAYHLRAMPQIIAMIVSFVVSWGLALLIARYGEILLFGRRR